MTYVLTNFNTHLNTYSNQSSMEEVDSNTLTEGYGAFYLLNNQYYTFSFTVGVPISTDILLNDGNGKWILYNKPYLYMNKLYTPNNVYYPSSESTSLNYFLTWGTQSGTSTTTTITITTTLAQDNITTDNISVNVTFTSAANRYGYLYTEISNNEINIITQYVVGLYTVDYTVIAGPDFFSSV